MSVNKVNIITNHKGLFHIYVYVPAGSIYEEERVRGISHLLEHMVLKHTKKYTEKQLLSEITSLGGSYNAVTDRDVTFYYIMSHIDNYKKCVDLLHSAIVEPVFTEQELNMERKVVLEEIRRRQDNDAELFNVSYLTILSPDNKYAKPIEGYEKTLNSVTVDDLYAYWKKCYQNVMVMVNCDSIKKREAEKYLMSKFGPQRPIENDEIRDMFGSIGYRSSLIVLPREYSQYSVHLLFPAFPRAMVRENTILNFIRYCLVSAGLYSILMYELRSKRGLVYSISSMNETYRYIGIMRIALSTSNHRIDHIMALVIDVLTDLQEKGLPKKTLDYFQRGYINEQKYALTSDEFKTMLYGESLFYGNTPMTDKEYIAMIRGITNDDIKDIANKIFDYKKIGVLAYGNFRHRQQVQRKLAEMIESYELKKSVRLN